MMNKTDKLLIIIFVRVMKKDIIQNHLRNILNGEFTLIGEKVNEKLN